MCKGFIIGPLLFNTYTCGIFYGIKDLEYASFAYNNIHFIGSADIISILENLKNFLVAFTNVFKGQRQ